jgi:hypothetical protein
MHKLEQIEDGASSIVIAASQVGYQPGKAVDAAVGDNAPPEKMKY